MSNRTERTLDELSRDLRKLRKSHDALKDRVEEQEESAIEAVNEMRHMLHETDTRLSAAEGAVFPAAEDDLGVLDTEGDGPNDS